MKKDNILREAAIVEEIHESVKDLKIHPDGESCSFNMFKIFKGIDQDIDDRDVDIVNTAGLEEYLFAVIKRRRLLLQEQSDLEYYDREMKRVIHKYATGEPVYNFNEKTIEGIESSTIYVLQ